MQVTAIENMLDLTPPTAPIISSPPLPIVEPMPTNSPPITTRRTHSPISSYNTSDSTANSNQALNSEMNDIKGNVNSLASQLASIQDTLKQALGLPQQSSSSTSQQ